jgi:hypothetical protein
MPPAERIEVPNTYRATTAPRFKFHDSKGAITRYCGVELEGYGIPRPAYRVNAPAEYTRVLEVCRKWGADFGSDGSVSGPDPFEIRLMPARGDLFVKQVREITKVILENGGKVNETCGTHVHVDARDFEGVDVVKAAVVWSKFEPYMLAQVAPHRRTQRYCNPWGTTFTNILAEHEKRGSTLRQTYDDIYRTATAYGKGCSFNMYPLANYGTIENRMLEGTLDANKIIRWAFINSRILNMVKEMELEDLKKLEVKIPKLVQTTSASAYNYVPPADRASVGPSVCSCSSCRPR